MVLSSETKRSSVRIRATSIYASITTCIVLACSLVMYASLHVLHSSDSNSFPRRLDTEVSAHEVSTTVSGAAGVVVKSSLRTPKPPKKLLAPVIVVDDDSSSSDDDSGDDDEAGDDSSSLLQKLLDRIVLPPVGSNQASLFRNVRDEYEKSLPMSEAETKDTYLSVYERLYKEAPGVFSFGDHGRDMIDSIIKALCADPKRETVTVMEVGVWFGNSLARWLKLDPKVRVVGVDPFVAVPTQQRQVSLMKPHEKTLLGNVDFYRGLMVHNIREQLHGKEATDRTLAVAGFFPQGVDFLFEAHRKQQAPDIDIFYIDAGKVSDTSEHLDFVTSITKVMEEFPNVIVFGENWKHGTHFKEFQKLVRELAAKYGRTILLSEDRTWIMAKLKSDFSY
eukprot:scaffold2294_cov106-Cylindrotheca_fusiformis.AAC.10